VSTRRLENKRRMWTERLAAAIDPAARARLAFDRARAACRSAERAGRGEAWTELAQVLAQWAQRWETWEADRDRR
jgi:hypothetical protein